MAFISTTPAEAATDDVKSMYLRQQSAYDYVPGYAKVFCYRPELMSLWADLQRGIKRHIAPREFELVTVASAVALRSTGCSLAHADKLRAFFNDEEIRAIVEGRGLAEGVISAADAAMIEFAAKIARDASGVTHADVELLKAHGFTDEQVFDFAVTAAARAFFTKVVDGLGATNDHDFADFDRPLRECLTVGRAIRVGERERIT